MPSGAGWEQDAPIVDIRRLTPDSRYVHSLGHNHRLDSAVADLIDNSLDARATDVIVRITRTTTALRSLLVIDNGEGIDPDDIDRSMTVGAGRRYRAGDLGHFGIGMKAASLGQAEKLTVLSKSASGWAGRVLLTERASMDFECGVVDPEFVERAFRAPSLAGRSTGTIVRWDRVKAFPSHADPVATDRLTDHTVRLLRQHLGVIFHRLISERARITVDVEDLSSEEPPIASAVEPIDPFGYARPGATGFPSTYDTELASHPLRLICHVWPPRSQLPAFRLPGRNPVECQGFYFYRNERLWQCGGWNDAVVPSPQHQLARVAVDVPAELLPLLVPNPEKTHVATPAGFADAVNRARDERGMTFARYLEVADQAFTQSRRRTRSRRKVAPPGKGLAPQVKRALHDELEYLHGHDAVDIVWGSLPDGVFFDVDFEGRRIVLNGEYRRVLSGHHRGALNDAPLAKAMLYLLVEPMFAGAYLGPKERDDLLLYQAILTAAAHAQAR